MSVDITLQVIKVAKNHFIDQPEATAARSRVGDIINVARTSDWADWDGTEYRIRDGIRSPNVAFFHITDVPNNLALKIRNVLLRAATIPHPDPNSDAGDFIRQRLRQWRIPPSILPQSVIDKLQSEQEITIAFAVAKPFVRKKIVNNALDASADNEDTELADSDLS